MEQTECSETSAFKIQTPGNYPKESVQHTEHGENLKLRIRVNNFSHIWTEYLKIPDDSFGKTFSVFHFWYEIPECLSTEFELLRV